MTIAITGVTGFIGRNLMFEFIKQYLDNLSQLKIIVFGRSKGNNTLRERIHNIFREDGIYYIYGQPDESKVIIDFLTNQVIFVDSELQRDNLGIDEHVFQHLKTLHIDYFFHSAADTDLRNYDCLFNHLVDTNLFGTDRLLQLAEHLNIKEFCYISTAYACGLKTGLVKPDYFNLLGGFRSHYELVKILAELRVKAFGERTGTRVRLFRPSSVCGRLMEKPLGMIPKFDIFYYWGACMLKMKLKYYQIPYSERYSTKVIRTFRVKHSQNAGLNIVPVDYISKLMYHICNQNDPGESYHLVCESETLHSFHLKQILKSINLEGMLSVVEQPDDPDHFESAYYKTAGAVFEGYINSDPILFDTSNLKEVLSKSGLKCPEINEENFGKLIDFAKAKDFGLKLNPQVQKNTVLH